MAKCQYAGQLIERSRVQITTSAEI